MCACPPTCKNKSTFIVSSSPTRRVSPLLYCLHLSDPSHILFLLSVARYFLSPPGADQQRAEEPHRSSRQTKYANLSFCLSRDLNAHLDRVYSTCRAPCRLPLWGEKLVRKGWTEHCPPDSWFSFSKNKQPQPFLLGKTHESLTSCLLAHIFLAHWLLTVIVQHFNT